MCNPLSKSYSTILISCALEAKKVIAKNALVNIFFIKSLICLGSQDNKTLVTLLHEALILLGFIKIYYGYKRIIGYSNSKKN